MYPFASFLLILNVLYLTITYQKTGTLVFRSFFFYYYYFVFLMKLFQDGLLERQEVLQWILDLLDRLKLPNNEDGLSRLLLSLALQYLHEFVQSEQLSRKLVYLCARKISSMCSLSNNSANTTIESNINHNNSNSSNTTMPQTSSPASMAVAQLNAHPSSGSNFNNSNVANSNIAALAISATAAAGGINNGNRYDSFQDIPIAINSELKRLILRCFVFFFHAIHTRFTNTASNMFRTAF